MWSNIISAQTRDEFSPEESAPHPPSRHKHASAILDGEEPKLYVFGGNSNRFALKDFWELSLSTNEWREIRRPVSSPNEWPPKLQEHSLVSANNRLYVFGGELCANSDTSSHVWVWSKEHEALGWEKIRFKDTKNGPKSYVCAPCMRRSHTAVTAEVDGALSMVVYGGYRDLKGSLPDCWSYCVVTNSWSLVCGGGTGSNASSPGSRSFWTNILSYWSSSSHANSYVNLSGTGGNYRTHENSSSSVAPPARHSHSAAVFNGKMYVYGGMSNLDELSDLWYLNLDTRTWTQIKCIFSPGALKGHSACTVGYSMYLFGGETKSGVMDDVWRFDYVNETFEKLSFPTIRPCARVFASVVRLPVRRKQREVEQPKQLQSQAHHVFRKSTSVVRFADHVSYSDGTPMCTSEPRPSDSDYYSSCSTINYVENPNYRRNGSGPEAYEMKQLGPWDRHRITRSHAEYILLIGGLESHKSSVFSKRDLVLWRLRVDCNCVCEEGDDEEERSGEHQRHQSEIENANERLDVEF